MSTTAWVIAYAAGVTVAFIGGFWAGRPARARRRPFDWSIDSPELGRPAECHVRLVTRRAENFEKWRQRWH
jgi:hypothetical protein